MFTDTDREARRRAIARNEKQATQSALDARNKASDDIYKQVRMSTAQVAQYLRRQVRANYRKGNPPVAIVRICSYWRETPGYNAINDQLRAKLEASLGKDVTFKLEIRFFDAIIPAEDELHDDWFTVPAGTAKLIIINPT